MAKFLTDTDKRTLGDFWQASIRYKRNMFFIIALPISALSFNVVVPYAISGILAQLTDTQGSVRSLVWVMVLGGLVGVVGNRVGFWHMMSWQVKVMQDLQEKTFNMLLSRSLGFHANNVGGKLISDATDYPKAFSQLTNTVIINLIPFMVIMLSGSILVLIKSWQVGLVIIATSCIIIGWAWIQSRRRYKNRTRRHAASKKIVAHLADTVTNVATVKGFAHEGEEFARHQELGTKLAKLRHGDWTYVAKDGSNRFAALFTMQLILVLYLIYAVRANPDLLTVGIFAFTYTIMLTGRLFAINDIIRTVEEALLEAAPMTEYLGQHIEIRDSIDADDLFVSDASLHVDSITFAYQDSSQTSRVFENLSTTIPSTQKVGLVGPSGGGKSTLMKLLLRFEDVQAGAVRIDGQDISKVTQKSLRQAIAYVPQEPLLFHRSIRKNIAYGNPDATDKQVKAAAKKAHAHEFILKLPDGYNTIVGERGVKLSGGQRQRIAIARAILKDAPILLLDEATSALDSESEKQIQEALKSLMVGRTVVVIAHRLSTIHELDRILVIDDGQIIEDGTHTELLKTKQLYAKLWQRQSGGFIDE